MYGDFVKWLEHLSIGGEYFMHLDKLFVYDYEGN